MTGTSMTKFSPGNSRLLVQVVATGSLVLALLAGLAGAELKPKRQATQTFMRNKLTLSQAALEGITLERFDLVSKNAIRMRDMTQSNQWYTFKQPDYMARTTQFQKSVDALYLAAVDKKLEVATEAYVDVMRNCVECHRIVRAAQRKNAGEPVKPRSELELKPSIGP